MEANKELYILFGAEGSCRGVYSSEEPLREGVSYWMESFPEETLSYQKWGLNYAPEPNSWEWCYIPLGSIPYDLAKGGASVPQRIYWGKNLVGTEWESIPEWDQAYE